MKNNNNNIVKKVMEAEEGIFGKEELTLGLVVRGPLSKIKDILFFLVELEPETRVIYKKITPEKLYIQRKEI
jgi:hypothetical protein